MKVVRLIAFFAVFALVGAACGDDDTDTTAPTGGGEIEVVWIRGADHPEGIAFLEVLAQFTAETGIQVNYQGLGDDLPTILSTRVQGGDPPDVAVLAQPGLLKDLVARGAAKPVSQTVIDGMAANFAPVWSDLATVDGTLYGVYFKAGNKSLVFYDVQVFDDLAITPPTTWDEWIAVSQTLADNGYTALAVAGADGWTLSDWFENVYVRTAGQEKYVQLTNHEIPWTDQSVVDALAVMAELVANPDFVLGGRDGALQTNFVASITAVFATADAVVVEGPGDIAGIAKEEAGAEVGTDLDFFPFPSIDGSPPAVLGGGDVAVALTDNPGAMALLEFLTTPAAVETWAAAGGFTSPNQNLDLSLYPDELSRAVAEGLVNAEVFVFDLSDLVPSAFGGTAGAGIWGGLQNWLQNPDNVAAVLAQIEAEAEAAMAE
ncbi:MAG: extracellular solute-binding protein [Actinomycetota bacterium]|nr:extracellular solute-binding protein [Actinomycetota bacterium]